MKKLEKLNLRITDAERDRYADAARRAGFESVSAWSRHVLLTAADQALADVTRPARDLALYVGSGHLRLATGDEHDAVVTMSLAADVVVEGLVVDPEALAGTVREACRQLRQDYDLSRAAVIVTGRLLPSTIPQLKTLVAAATGLADVFTIEFSMANALGVGLDVTAATPQPILSLGDDWSEMGVVCGAGLRGKRSLGTTDLAALGSHLASVSLMGPLHVAVNDTGDCSDDDSDDDSHDSDDDSDGCVSFDDNGDDGDDASSGAAVPMRTRIARELTVPHVLHADRYPALKGARRALAIVRERHLATR